jgi:hypothetical protein
VTSVVLAAQVCAAAPGRRADGACPDGTASRWAVAGVPVVELCSG